MAKIWIVWRDCGERGTLPLNAFVYEAVARDYLITVMQGSDAPDEFSISVIDVTPETTETPYEKDQTLPP
jgi:hypothetical protein